MDRVYYDGVRRIFVIDDAHLSRNIDRFRFNFISDIAITAQ
jgi:hypothetical protein